MHTTQTNEAKADFMKHPAEEQWMAYLYGELPAAKKNEMAAHLKQCTNCGERVTRWRETMRALDAWKIKTPIETTRSSGFLKWGIAAALMIGIGLGFGVSHIISSSAQKEASLKIRAEVRAEMKTQMAQQREEILLEVTKVLDEKRAEDNRATAIALRQINAAHRADYNSLHKDLETMAVMTETSLRQAQQQIVTLANYSETDNNSTKQ
jgi:anti-sigma factor ChrR (cupin superfamily)